MTEPVPELHDVLTEAGLRVRDVAELLATVRADLTAELDVVVAEHSDGAAIPELDADEIAAGGPALDRHRERIARRGCAVIRGTFDPAEATAWDRELGDYLDRNRFAELIAERYPEAAAGGSRIWGIYWSRPQVLVRQHDRTAMVRCFLNSVWRHASDGARWFDPDEDIGYPDRVRRRPPGVAAKGLAPHIDTPSSGGWRIPENRAVFAEVLAGRPGHYDPWDAAHRTTLDVESPVSCSVFRTFQGWTALTEMRPADGVLHLVPVPAAVAFLFVEAIAAELGVLGDDVRPGRRLGDHELLRRAYLPIPAVAPGDTVWWHGDLVHGVGAATNDTRWNDLLYVGAAPRCARNDAYAPTMLGRFDRGESPVDFPDEHLEADFVGRATRDDLNDRGRRQFGLASSRPS